MEQIDLEGGRREYEGGEDPAPSPTPNTSVPGLKLEGLLAGLKKGAPPTVGGNTDASPRPEDDMSKSQIS